MANLEAKIKIMDLEKVKKLVKQNKDLIELLKKIKFEDLEVETIRDIEKVIFSED